VIIYLAVVVFEKSYIQMVTTTFSALICVEIYNIAASISRPNKIMIITCGLSLVAYFVSIVLMPDYLEVGKYDLSSIINTIVIVAVACLPLSALKNYMSTYHPSED
jgi:uncharacterized membrane protein (DUF373 family)